MMPTVETTRLYLRMFTPDDLDDLYGILSDPDVMRYVAQGKPVSREETESALHSVIRHWERHSFGRWAVIDKASRKFIGYGGLRMLIDTPEVVYHLAKAYWGRGVATEMAQASLRYGFNEHGFDRIVAIAKPENKASIHVMEKIGMRYEMHAVYFDVDVVQYSISRQDFDKTQP